MSGFKAKLMKLKSEIAPYETMSLKASIKQIFNTIGMFVILWAASYFLLSVSYWLALPAIVLAALFLVRTFIIFHDCCHQSFFKSRKANQWLGTLTGVLTLVPYEQWKYTHSVHHATSSNLDKRGVGDMWIMTVDEYIESPVWRKLAYRFYRNPFVMLVLGPLGVFGIQYRFNRRGAKRKERLNTYLTNVLIVALYTALCLLIGWKAFLMIQMPILLVSGALGIWLFYVQHQFEDTYFEGDEDWNFVQAAVEGSSYYKLPRIMQWLTGNIGFHHVHHLSPRVPNYYLEKAHEASPDLQKAVTITLRTSLTALKFRLWDEDRKRFISFREMKRAVRAAPQEKPIQVKSGVPARLHGKSM